MKQKGIIFDMDGLMFDTERLGYDRVFGVVEKFGYTMLNNILDKTIGVNKKTAIEIFKNYFGEDFPAEEILIEKRRLVNEYLEKNGVPIKPGLLELLDYLDKYKIKKVVATSSYRKVAENILKKAGVYDRFDDIVCGDEVQKSKPEPDIFLKALEKLNLLVDEVIILEDSRMGILAAHRANIKSIMVPDILPADEETKKLYYAECKSLLEVKNLLIKQKLIYN